MLMSFSQRQRKKINRELKSIGNENKAYIKNLESQIVQLKDEIVSLKNVIEKLSTNAYKTETKTKYEENKDVVSKLISDEKYAFETMNNNIKQDPESVLSLRKKVFQLLLEFIYKLFKIVYNIQLNLL